MAIQRSELSHPPEVLRCPTCGARQGWSDSCRRCKSDLRLLRATLEAYERHRRLCLTGLETGRLESALRHARRCHELAPGPVSHRLLAVCQFLRGDWPDAVAFARGVDEVESENEHENESVR